MVSPLCVLQMELLKGLPLRRTFLAVILNLLALTLSTTALLGSYWCTGTQKVPKPLCGKTKAPQCIGVPIPSEGDPSNISSEDSVHYSWETGDDRFAFRYFHTGMWLSCEESLEGTGSVLLRQPQLIALYLLPRSWKLKGGRLRILRRKVFYLFLDDISPVHCCSQYISVLHWNVQRAGKWRMVVSLAWNRGCEMQVMVVMAVTLWWHCSSSWFLMFQCSSWSSWWELPWAFFLLPHISIPMHSLLHALQGKFVHVLSEI